MEIKIYRRDAEVGTLQAAEDGLYRVLHARIRPAGEILRLYLFGKSFGVFCPENGELTLVRRVSRCALPALPDRAFAWCPSDGAWSKDAQGLVRYTPEGPQRAIRWRTDGPMRIFAAPGRLKAFRRGDEVYLVSADQ